MNREPDANLTIIKKKKKKKKLDMCLKYCGKEEKLLSPLFHIILLPAIRFSS